MKKFWLILLIIGYFSMPACSYIFPNASKAQTEKEQLEEIRKQNELLKTQNETLITLSNNTADIAERLSRILALAKFEGLCVQR